MSLIFRTVLSNRGAQRCISNMNFVLHTKFNLPVPNSGKCNCKISWTSTSFRRDYSSKNTEIKKTGTEKPPSRETVYQGFLAKSIRRLKFLSVMTSTVGVSIQPILYNKVVTAGTVTPMTLPLFGFIALLAISTPPLLHMITRRYVVQVDFDSENDKYIATVYNILAMKKEIEFTPDDVTMPTVQGMFSNCIIKGHPAFLDSKFFTDQNHYIRIMGYDKPIDFQVDDSESCPNKKSD